MSETKLVDLWSLFHIFLTPSSTLFYYSTLFAVRSFQSFVFRPTIFLTSFFCSFFSMKEELRAGKNRRCFEEIINYCNEYEKDIEKVDYQQHQSQDMFHQHHQFGAISFYSHTTTGSPGKSSPGNTLQHKR